MLNITSSKAVNLRLSEEVCKRIPNINKLHIIYDDRLNGYDDCLFDHLHNLHSLHKLQSLKLVASLYHSSHADWFKCTFPRSLHKLSLKNGHLDWKCLTIIGSLPQLEVLKLEKGVVGDNWSPVCGEFLSLKSLTISHCSLRCWTADDSHFPVLKKLHLVGLLHLEEIPSGIGDVATLQLICVEGCSKSVINSAMEIKDEQESLGNDGLYVQIIASGVIERFKIQLKIQRGRHLEFASGKSLDYLSEAVVADLEI